MRQQHPLVVPWSDPHLQTPSRQRLRFRCHLRIRRRLGRRHNVRHHRERNFMRRILRGRENLAALLLTVVGVVIVYYGERLSSSYYQSVAANLGTGVVALAAGIALVNVYFDYHSRKRAVRPLIQLITPSIQRHQNDLLDEAWNIFGKPQFGEMMKRYADNNGDPLAWTPEERKRLYDMVKAKRDEHDRLLQKLDAELKELGLILEPVPICGRPRGFRTA